MPRRFDHPMLPGIPGGFVMQAMPVPAILVLVVIDAALVGCTSPAPASGSSGPGPDTAAPGATEARIALRHDGASAGIGRVEVLVDGTPFGLVGPNCALLMALPPGKRELTLRWEGGAATCGIWVAPGAISGYALSAQGRIVAVGTGADADAACGPAG